MLSQTLLNSSSKQNSLYSYEKHNFALLHAKISSKKALTPSLKLKFKAKYKYHIAILAGLNILFVMASRDCAISFFHTQRYLKGQHLHILDQLYYITNFFIPLFVGYITDYIGYHLGLIALHFPTIIGSLFIMISTFHDEDFNLETAMVGRLLFSFGGESLQIILYTVVVNYFRQSTFISYGLIITLSVVFLGYAVFKMFLMIEINRFKDELVIPLWEPALYSLIFICISLVLSSIIIIFEKYWKKFVKNSNLLEIEEISDKNFLNEQEIYPYSFWQAFQNILNVPIFLMALMNGMVWGSIFSMTNYNTVFFLINHSGSLNEIYNYQMATEFFSLVLYFFMFLTALFLIRRQFDHTKNKNFIIMLGCLLNIFSYTVFSVFYQNDQGNIALLYWFYFLGLINLGVGMGFFTSAVYASLPHFTSDKNLTICFGFVFSITNIILFGLLFCLPSVVSHHLAFYGSNPFWVLCCFSFILALIMEGYERYDKNKEEFRKGEEYA